MRRGLPDPTCSACTPGHRAAISASWGLQGPPSPQCQHASCLPCPGQDLVAVAPQPKLCSRSGQRGRTAPGPGAPIPPARQGHQPLQTKVSPSLVLLTLAGGLPGPLPWGKAPRRPQKALGMGGGSSKLGLRLRGSISPFPVDGIIVFLQPLTHVAFICFISRHEHTRWKLCLTAKLKTFGFPVLSTLAGTLHSLLGWFLGGGGSSLGFSQPPYLTQQSAASWLVAGGPSVARGALPVVGVGRLGSRAPLQRLHCVSSPAPRPHAARPAGRWAGGFCPGSLCP